MDLLQALIVDDNDANRDFLMRLITQAGFKVEGAATGAEARAALASGSFQLALVDMQLPDTSGLHVTRAVRKHCPDALIVVATMYDDHSWIQGAFAAGCDLFLVKPHGFMTLYKELVARQFEVFRARGPQILDQHGMRSYTAGTAS